MFSFFSLAPKTMCSVWRQYKSTINFKRDVRAIFIRTDNRHAVLDGVRAITLLLMVLFHVLFGIVALLKKNGDMYMETFIAEFPSHLSWLWQSQGSDPLFILCGLLVSAALFREYEKNNSINIGGFYRRRLMRVLPLFFLALLIFIPSDSDNLRYLWSNLLFVSNHIPHHRPIISVGWSLEVQMQFYFLLPFFMLLLYSVSWRLTFLIVTIFASFAWRYWIVSQNPDLYEIPFYQVMYDKPFSKLLADTLYYDIDVRIGSFMLGILVAYVYQYHATIIKKFLSQHPILNTLLVTIAIAMLVLSLSIPIENKNSWYYDNYNSSTGFWFLVFDRYLYSLGLSLLILCVLCPVGISKSIAWLLSWRIWHPIAQLIFPLYLFHFVFLLLAAVLTFQTLDRHSIVFVHNYQVFILFFWTLLLTLIFSVIAHIYIEKPFIVMRENK